MKKFWVHVFWFALRRIPGGSCSVDNRFIRTFKTPNTITTVTIQSGKETLYSREELAIMYNIIQKEFERTGWKPDW